MAINRISYTQHIPGIKVTAASVSEANEYIGQVTQGEVFLINGELFYKAEKNSTSLTPVSQGLVATGTLTSAQILALNATPITLIAAPGAGKLIVVEEIQLFLDYNSAAYVAAAGEDLAFEYTGTASVIAVADSDDGFITATADEHLLFKPAGLINVGSTAGNDGLIFSTNANKGIDVTIQTGEVATGDSPIKYKITYRIVDQLT